MIENGDEIGIRPLNRHHKIPPSGTLEVGFCGDGAKMGFKKTDYIVSEIGDSLIDIATLAIVQNLSQSVIIL